MSMTPSPTGAPASSQAQSDHFYVVTYLEVAPSAAHAAADLLGRMAELARQAKGNLRFEVLERIRPTNQFVTVAVWKDKSAFEAARDAASPLLDRLAPHLISGIDTRLHAGTVGGTEAARGRGEVYVVTHVDVPPPHKDACIELLKQLVADSRKEPANLRFEVFQQADRPNHFSVVEAWKGAKEHETHIVATHTKTFRHKLTPIGGGLYDERLYVLAE